MDEYNYRPFPQGVVPMEITFMDHGGKYNSYYVNS
jgi:hypothetical protein